MYSLDIYFKIFQYFERAIRSKWWMRYPFCSSSWYFHEFFSLHWKEEDHVKMQIKYILLWRTYNLNTYLLLVQSMHQTRICFSSSWPYTPFHIAVWLTAAQQSTWTPACPQLPTAWYMQVIIPWISGAIAVIHLPQAVSLLFWFVPLFTHIHASLV